MNRTLAAAVATAGALIFLLLMPDASSGDVLLAAAVGVAALALSGLRVRPGASYGVRFTLRTPVRLGLLVAYALQDIAVGSWRLALASLGMKQLHDTGIVELPLGERSLHGAAVNGLIVTLAPGTVLLDIDREARVMIFHVAGTEVEELRASVERLYALQRTFIP